MAEVRGKTGEKQSMLNRHFLNLCAVFFIFTQSIEETMLFALCVACFVS